MANQKISELTAIITIDNSADVLPIVDTSANTTKKVTPTQLKTSLALDNVDNTSDADKPVSIAQQDALNAKVSSNAAITAGTAPKITFDTKGLVTSGDSLDETDLPTGINANKIGTGVVSTTEFEYLNGVTSAIQTQIDSKQATLVSGTNIKTVNSTSLLGSGDVAVQETLVSGTNIKTINSTSLLGSGDITISANPSGVAGAIQFSDGSAFASDAANLFWNNTTKRLGIGTAAPSRTLTVTGDGARIKDLNIGVAGSTTIGNTSNINLNFGSAGIGIKSNAVLTPTALFQIQGSGTTSGTTSLLVQNSAGTTALSVKDDLTATFGGATTTNGDLNFVGNIIRTSRGRINFYGTDGEITLTNSTENGFGLLKFGGLTSSFPALKRASNNIEVKNADDTFGAGLSVGAALNASAILQADSTTRGFLPPQMTTTQKNAIATPAAGLVVYDSTTNKLCCYNGSTWNDLF